MCLDAVSGGRKITFRGPREQPLTYHILLKSTIRALTILFRYHAARVLALGFEIFLTLKFRIGLDWLHKTLFDERSTMGAVSLTKPLKASHVGSL